MDPGPPPPLPGEIDFEDYPVDRQSCQLLGPTALIVQSLMGVVVILSLLYKRQREKPKRPWRIWLFDVSKQVVGQMFVHGVNVLISDVGSHRTAGNACVFYFLNILVDTTLGVACIYLILRVTTHILSERFQFKGYESGQYGTPPSVIYWLRQAAVYVFALTSMKILVLILFALFPGIFKLGDWLLSWLGHGDAVQVIFTMGLFPILMNVLQFWLIDSIVKASTANPALTLPSDAEAGSSPHTSEDRQPLFRASNEYDSDSDNEGLDTRHPHHHTTDLESQTQVTRRSNPPSRSNSAEPKNARRLSTDSDPKDTFEPSSTHSSSSHISISHPTPKDADPHAYPPSLGSSPSSSSRRTMSCSPGSRMLSGSISSISASTRKRRSPPPPLLPRSPMQPAINSPSITQAMSMGAGAEIEMKVEGKGDVGARRKHRKSESGGKDEWGWDSDGEGETEAGADRLDVKDRKESALTAHDDDWANRVGEEDWTGRRMEARKGEVEQVWKSTA
ncbi:uncharacterized protein STEHIDRAFT_76464 [Stereum hirsutum FP-91666 SS1]|uniref:uncharacterized protein n=1 Tax=Stereum hirsutum (strain FP-91666) TaxID=721885 RepID=UPI000440ED95|nr:uncharacterized protein STEHIDRAFT_76464 [Stereum hirsutum FP-91666 SS1]EIM87847.1 hypothetical protein STEHIDRAFT_76464 [Stereum hirsutum FP-91666 SS1]